MKKALKISGVVLVVIIALLLAIPYIFKDKIVEQIKVMTNESLNATVNFSDVDLSLFRSFPNLSVNVEDLTVVGKDEFEGVTMAKIKNIYAKVDLSSLFGETYQINAIKITDGDLDIRVLKDGTANYDIAIESEEMTEETGVEEESIFSIDVQEYILKNINLKYDDQSLPMLLNIESLDHKGTGDLTADQTLLNTITEIKKVNFEYDGIQYIKNAKAEIEADLDLDLKNSKYTFKENEIKLNELLLKADGFVSMPADDIEMDLTFKTIDNNLRNLISMIPAYFAQDLNGVDITGLMGIEGFVKGIYNDNSMPGFGMDINVDKGGLNYVDLPKSIKSINIDAHIDTDGGADFNDLEISVPKFYMELAENPIDIKLELKNAMIDPQLDCDIRAKVILDHLKDVVPLEKGDALEGYMIADLSMHGKLSSIENERYDEFEANGIIQVEDILFKSDSLPFDMNITTGYFEFNPQFLELTQFKADIGKSDIQARGKITNYLAYLMKDETLEGVFAVSSENMDLNELMVEQEPVATEGVSETAETSQELASIDIPGNIDFDLGADFKNLTYGDIEMTNVHGNIRMKDKGATMVDVFMNVLQGSINMNGSYDANDLNRPLVDVDLDMKNIDIQESAEKFYTIEKMAPIAKSCKGKFSTKMKLKTALNNKMEPIEESIEGGGRLMTDQVYIEKFKPLNEIANTLGIERLAKQTIENINVTYAIEKGRATVQPFEIKVDGMKTTISGSTGLLDQSIDYNVNMDVPFEKFPSSMAQQADGLISKINSKLGTNLSAGDKVPMDLKITGTIDQPKISSNYGELVKGGATDIKDALKDEAKELIDTKVEEGKDLAKEKAQAEADKILADAREEADKILADAKTLADKAKADAYKEADKVENSYKNLLEKAGKKLAADAIRTAADKAHEKSLQKARERADGVLADAKAQSDAKINAID